MWTSRRGCGKNEKECRIAQVKVLYAAESPGCCGICISTISTSKTFFAPRHTQYIEEYPLNIVGKHKAGTPKTIRKYCNKVFNDVLDIVTIEGRHGKYVFSINDNGERDY